MFRSKLVERLPATLKPSSPLFVYGLHRIQTCFCWLSATITQDEMCRRDFGEWHCNAHSNNIVVLEQGIPLQISCVFALK